MKSKNILIVEDNELNRKLFENLIGQIWNYQSATNGLEAIEKVKSQDFDLILMDIQMPHLDGISTLNQIRNESLASCPIIAVTAYADESDRKAFLTQGFDEFITKPIRPREFIEIVQGFINEPLQTETEQASVELKDVILDPDVVEQLGKYNKPEMIKQVYLDFVLESQTILNQIWEQLTSQQEEDILASLHILKGNSGTLGANRLFQATQKTEIAAKNGDMEEFIIQFENLRKEFESFHKYLNEATIFEP